MTQVLTPMQAGHIRAFLEVLPPLYIAQGMSPRRASGIMPGMLAREYGTCPDTIRNIRKGLSHARPRKPRKDRKLTQDQARWIRVVAAYNGLGPAQSALVAGLTGTDRYLVNGVLRGGNYREAS